jgi:hypothetical protein
MALTTCDSADLKAQVLIMSLVSKGIQFKENSPEEGLNERYKGRRVLGEPGASYTFWRRL